jgi:hypothetical protein
MRDHAPKLRFLDKSTHATTSSELIGIEAPLPPPPSLLFFLGFLNQANSSSFLHNQLANKSY